MLSVLGVMISVQDIRDKIIIKGIIGLIINVLVGIAFVMLFLVPVFSNFISIFIHN